MKPKNTTELSLGDVVMELHIRVLLDQPPTIYGQDAGYDIPMYVYSGRVINRDEVREVRLDPDIHDGRFMFQGTIEDTWTVMDR